MPDLLVTAEMPMTGVNAGDKAVNNFVIHKPTAFTVGNFTTIHGAVEQFYNGGQSLAKYLAANLDRGAGMASIKCYDITGKLGNRGPGVNGKEQGPTPHGSPVSTSTWSLDAATSTQDLPPQAAVVMTLRARNFASFPVEAADDGDFGSATNRPRQRVTGRIYLGPLNWSALAAGGADLLFGVKATMRADLLAVAENFQELLNAAGMAWCVWSRQGNSVSVIERAEVDNSFDVIRRRKSAPTVRDVATFAPVPDLALGA